MRQQMNLALACGFFVLGCGDREFALSPTLKDPMVVAPDGLAPANGVDGLGSLFLGSGWGRPEGSGNDPDWKSMAWVVGREAAVHALVPPVQGLDFYARCLPYPWEAGAPQQEMELLVGQRVVGRVELLRDWQDLRIPLPDSLAAGELVDLRLRFAHALKPLDRGGADPRSLAAAFTLLAIVPRSVADPRQFVGAHAFDPETGRVALPPGGGLRLPLPARSHIRIRLSDLRSVCEGCEVALELAGHQRAKRVLPQKWRRDHQTIEASFDTDRRSIQTLWIRASDSAPQGGLEFILAASVEARRRPWWRRWEDTAPPTHVFVYVIDTLRADELGAQGGKPELTRSMNAFGEESVTYSRARAPSSWTLPSVVSLLTGLYPDRHGVMTGELQYDPGLQPSLQQLLGASNYRTVGISHSFIASAAYGVDAGFGSFYLSDHLNGLLLRSQESRGLLATWLTKHGDGSPLFVYIHTVDPHAPYTPPDTLQEEAGVLPQWQPMEGGLPRFPAAKDATAVAHLRSLYEAEVRHADREFGYFVDLLKWLGLYDQSFVILTADHGEEFAEHGGFEHGTTLFEEVLRVPLMVKYPGGRWSGARIETAVSLVDVAPTVLAEIGAETGPGFDGRVLPGPTAPRREQPVYMEVAPAHDPASGEAPVNLIALVSGDIKCIEDRAGVDRGGQGALRLDAFNLAADPGEQMPFAEDARETALCRQLMEAWATGRERQVRDQRSHRKVTPETLERLKALGYL